MPANCSSHATAVFIVIEFIASVFTEFIWLRPGWLLAIPVALLWLWYLSATERNAGWQKHLSSESLQHLRTSHLRHKYYRYFALPVIIASIAMAGPALESQPTGAATSERATVLVLDLSPSMAARDIQPDRLTQAKFKTIDILRQHTDGEIGLIVYAANAFRVTPLTDDPATIETLVPTLQLDIMPAPGSNAEAAITLAVDMLRESGTQSGAIILITDGITRTGLSAIEENQPGGFRLSVLGVGTEQGDSIPLESGVVTDANQQPVIARLNGHVLRQLAHRYDGRYSQWTADSADIDHLLSQKPLRASLSLAADSIAIDSTRKNDSQQFDRYQDLGYWLLLPLLVCAIYAFRKNALLAIFPLLLLSPQAKSQGLQEFWQNLWRNNEQQAQAHLQRENYDKAYKMFTRKEWKAIAAYHQGQYIEAAQLLDTPVYAEDLYNRGNAQALSGDLQAAMKSYSQALLLYGSKESSARTDTLHNINILKILIERNNEQSSDEAGGNDSADRDETPAENNGERNSEGSEPPAITEAPAPDAQLSDTNSQTRVGGSTGPGQSLDQQSLQENNGIDSAAPNHTIQDGVLATDASERLNPPSTTESLSQADKPDHLPAPQISEDSSQVLSPYSEQWLRDLPQDPGGYLRRKFLYQYQTSGAQVDDNGAASERTRY